MQQCGVVMSAISGHPSSFAQKATERRHHVPTVQEAFPITENDDASHLRPP
jgi:hypothetical protein